MASVPAVVFSGELTSAVYGQATPPMFAVIDVPPLASVFGVLLPIMAARWILNGGTALALALGVVR